ncbi:hypothetical protein [Adhaeribacter pallidiroseus]|nr:hypothetical protein [Adhaeribacter pallidiroseus]
MEKIKKYYACWFRLNQADKYLIWIDKENPEIDEPEEVFVNEQGRIPVFTSETELARYAELIGVEIENQEPGLINFDAVEEWLQEPNSYIDCPECLNAWNLFIDVAYPLKLTFNGDKLNRLRNRIYDKLFWGNNDFVGCPNLGHPSGDYYFPEWSPAEVRKLVKILKQGLKLFRRYTVEVQVSAIFTD